MKVILKEAVANLGEIGEIVNVADGYGRNYLLPRGLAAMASGKNIKAIENELKKKKLIAAEMKKDAESLAERIAQIKVTIERKAGEGDKLYGSVTSIDIEEALREQGLELDRKKILLSEPIKSLGDHAVPIKLHTEVVAKLNLSVVKENLQD